MVCCGNNIGTNNYVHPLNSYKLGSCQTTVLSFSNLTSFQRDGSQTIVYCAVSHTAVLMASGFISNDSVTLD